MIRLEAEAVLEGHEGRVWHASWSPDGLKVASCGEDRSVRVWVSAGSEKFLCAAVLDEAHTRTVRCCEWSPDGRLLATASFDGTIIVWKAQNSSFSAWDKLATLEGHDSEVKSVSWSRDGLYLASCGRDKKVWIWEKVGGADFECAAVLEGHSQDVKFVLWHPSQPVLFSCGYDDTIKIWVEELGDWHCAKSIMGHSSTVWGLAFGSEGRALVSCSDDQSAILWECESPTDPSQDWRRSSYVSNLHSCPIYTVHWNEKLNCIATGGGDNKVTLLAFAKESNGLGALNILYEEKEAHSGDVNCVRWNSSPRPDLGGLLATTGDDGCVKIWKLAL